MPQTVDCPKCHHRHDLSKFGHDMPRNAQCDFCGESLSRPVEEALIGVAAGAGGIAVGVAVGVVAAASAVVNALK